MISEPVGDPLNTLKQGDCIDCTLCVQVCPVGIDIRDGLQMECIACGLCIDACNEVMDKIDLPRGLIRYDTTRNQQNRAQNNPDRSNLLRPRTVYYTLILALASSVMLYSLLTRSPLELHVLHDRNPLFVQLSDGTVRNGYELKILNKTHEDKVYRMELLGLDGATMRLQGAGDVSAEQMAVFADSIGQFRGFITAPKQPQARADVQLRVTDISTGMHVLQDSIFVSWRE